MAEATRTGQWADANGVEHEYWFIYPVTTRLTDHRSGSGLAGVTVVLALRGGAWEPVIPDHLRVPMSIARRMARLRNKHARRHALTH